MNGIIAGIRLPCEQWFLQAGRYGFLSRSVRPGETTARRVASVDTLQRKSPVMMVLNVNHVFFSVFYV